MSQSLNLSPFILTINTLTTRQNYKVTCLGPGHTVEFIKFAIEQQLGINKDIINLVHQNRILRNTEILEECNIDRTSTITMVLSVKTGRS